MKLVDEEEHRLRILTQGTGWGWGQGWACRQGKETGWGGERGGVRRPGEGLGTLVCHGTCEARGPLVWRP